LKPTIEDAFSVGKLEGQKEALQEILDLLRDGIKGEPFASYVKARLKGLNVSKSDNPFKKGRK
jgi:hypothetical protein